MKPAGEVGDSSKFSPDDIIELYEIVKQTLPKAIREVLQERDLIISPATEFTRSKAVNVALSAVMEKTGANPETALELAVTLYEVAIDAMNEGQRLVLVDKDYRYVREVTGLVQEQSESPSREKVAG